MNVTGYRVVRPTDIILLCPHCYSAAVSDKGRRQYFFGTLLAPLSKALQQDIATGWLALGLNEQGTGSEEL